MAGNMMMPRCGLTFCDVSLAALECHGNRVRTAKRLGVGIRSLDAAIEREGLHRWFVSGRGCGKRPRRKCVTREQIVELAADVYLKADAAAILGISPAYLKDLIREYGITDFAENRGERVRIGMHGYCR
jgi:uncharacterized protein (DUF362 family)